MHIKFQARKKEFYIESDADNFIVHEGYKISTNKKGEEVKTRINPRYYGQLKYAISWLLDQSIKTSDAQTLQELYQDHNSDKRRVMDCFDYKE